MYKLLICDKQVVMYAYDMTEKKPENQMGEVFPQSTNYQK
jgi:hypothetical protein